MAQNDFSSLDLSKQGDADFPTNSLITKQSNCCEDDDYVPVNFISDEVRAMIKAWELARQKELELQEASGATIIMDGHAASQSPEIHEPIRYITDGAPPKRFYRTFWRSIARRVLEHDRKAVIAKMSVLCL